MKEDRIGVPNDGALGCCGGCDSGTADNVVPSDAQCGQSGSEAVTSDVHVIPDAASKMSTDSCDESEKCDGEGFSVLRHAVSGLTGLFRGLHQDSCCIRVLDCLR